MNKMVVVVDVDRSHVTSDLHLYVYPASLRSSTDLLYCNPQGFQGTPGAMLVKELGYYGSTRNHYDHFVHQAIR